MSFTFFDFPLQTGIFLQRLAEAGQQAEKTAAKQGNIERVANVAVVLLQHVEGAMVSRHLVNVKRDKGNDRQQRDEKKQDRGEKKQVAEDRLPGTEAEHQGDQEQAATDEKRNHRRCRRQSGDIAGDAVVAEAEQRSAAGSDDLWLQTAEVAVLQQQIESDQWREQQQTDILGPYQGGVFGALVEPVQTDPEGGGEKQDNFHQQHQPADFVGVQGPGRAHGADEQTVNILHRVDEQQPGENHEAEGVIDNRRNQPGFALQ